MPVSVIPVTGFLEQPVGAISQTDFPLISPRLVNPTDTLSINFGDPFVLNAGNTYSSVAQYITTNGVAAFLAAMQEMDLTYALGIAREAVQTNSYYPLQGGQSMAQGAYPPGTMVNGLTRGTINVLINNGTPAGAGSPVYIRTALNGSIPAGVVGQFEAVPDQTVASAAKAGGNTGNGTLGTLSANALAKNGAYTVTFLTATTFNVYDPLGKLLGSGATGTAFSTGGQITFTITAGGTAFVAGDGFVVTVTAKTMVVPNIVFKSGILSTDPVSGQVTAQVTILERKLA